MKASSLISTAVAPLVYVTTCAIGFHLHGSYEERRMKELSTAILHELADPEISIRFVANTIILEGQADERLRARAYEVSREKLAAFQMGKPWEKPQIINFIELKRPRNRL